MTMHLQDGVYYANSARIIGEVTIGTGSSIWYGVTIRGDVAPITIGCDTNVQENSVIHCNHGDASTIGDAVTIGHGATIHGILVDDGSLIGMGAILLGRSRVGKRCLVAAGTLVAPDAVIPDESVVMGIPGKVVRHTTTADLDSLAKAAETYRELSRRHHERPGDSTVKAWGVAK